ncbi:hypothetical protein NDI85_19660 [Halomicroarcula sp. S1AR25-4]|uniref:hypothetical protein n=1 Tax=Haloarcula sp. S1AR25-4 TaxID=2950538 RepID=UPI0028757085|nr:hypothetical protein [Halomicroarcula sp. S1AR25-4]MDS0280005.1 hypothetical protein [Halomicroarcula sp. S1AR25-4]
MTCAVEQRRRVRRAARAIRDAVPTEAVDVVAPTASEFDSWTLEAVVASEGVPPEVSRELALAGLTLRPRPAQGPFTVVVATV